MIIATWNVNSIRVRLPQVLDWLAQHKPDILCLQETKVIDSDFPQADFAAFGYQAALNGQSGYPELWARDLRRVIDSDPENTSYRWFGSRDGG